MEQKSVLTIKDVIKDSSWTENFEGKVVVLSEKCLNEKYRESKYQLWYATGGFGCDPSKMGRAVYATCLADGEDARWDRGDFIGVYTGELTEEQKSFIEKYNR